MEKIKKLIQMSPELRYNPYIRRELQREQRMSETESIRLMNQMPAKSGWIILLQNRINIKSVGNMRMATKVYYDRRTHMVGESPEECHTHFRMARLNNGQPAAGWIEDTNR